jgi:hypothetical protein
MDRMDHETVDSDVDTQAIDRRAKEAAVGLADRRDPAW